MQAAIDERVAAGDERVAAGDEIGLQIAVMHNHVLGDFSAVSAIDDLVTDRYR